MATSIGVGTTLLTLAGLAYLVLALLGTLSYVQGVRAHRGAAEGEAPGVSLLKPLRGVDAGMYEGLRSHCQQQYAGPIEIVFGVHWLSDPAVAEIERLKCEFPGMTIRLIECPVRLGTSGKVSNLVQMLPHTRYEHVVINDSDICVGPEYVSGVMRYFSDPRVGLVTVPYCGRIRGKTTVWSRLEALGISTEFIPGVLTARMLERGIRFGLGSTLATTKKVLKDAGGFEPLSNCLADDFELGRRIASAGYQVELAGERVETTVPEYDLPKFWDHQMRWARSTRDSRRVGYMGLAVTYGIPWAIFNLLVARGALWAWVLLALVLTARVSVALAVGKGVLRDEEVLRDLWLLPIRDCFGLLVWICSYAGDTVVWRGERFRLRDGQITPI